MHSISEKLKLIQERVFAKEIPEVDSSHCKVLLSFLRDNITTLADDDVLRIYGPNPFDAKHSAVYSRNGEVLCSLPSEEDEEEIQKMPQIAYTIKEIRDDRQETE